MSVGQLTARLALAAALAGATAAAWMGYRQPAFLVHLANTIWLCI